LFPNIDVLLSLEFILDLLAWSFKITSLNWSKFPLYRPSPPIFIDFLVACEDKFWKSYSCKSDLAGDAGGVSGTLFSCSFNSGLFSPLTLFQNILKFEDISEFELKSRGTLGFRVINNGLGLPFELISLSSLNLGYEISDSCSLIWLVWSLCFYFSRLSSFPSKWSCLSLSLFLLRTKKITNIKPRIIHKEYSWTKCNGFK
jgi:hypothetical protein